MWVRGCGKAFHYGFERLDVLFRFWDKKKSYGNLGEMLLRAYGASGFKWLLPGSVLERK